jgi:Cu/Zn superoxide dismutase
VRKALAVPAIALATAAFPLLTMSPALADHDGSYQADLVALNQSGVSGTGMVTLQGDSATVMVEATGLLAGAPHAQHFHIGAQGECPTDADDENGDGFVSVTEGAPYYGAIGASLTTSGDTSPESGLAIDRFPADGSISYSRTFDVSKEVQASFAAGTAVLVLHGVDQNGSGTYDGDVMSDLDPSLPMEATAPAACAPLTMAQMGTAPNGGAETGGGSTAGIEQQAAIGVGAVALVGAAAAGALAYRRRTAGEQA